MGLLFGRARERSAPLLLLRTALCGGRLRVVTIFPESESRLLLSRNIVNNDSFVENLTLFY